MSIVTVNFYSKPASAGSIRSRSRSRASAGSIRSRSRSRASAGSIRSRSLCSPPSRASAGSIRSRSLPPIWRTPALFGATLAQTGAFRRDQLKRSHEEASLEEDGLFEQHGGGVTSQPLLEFQLTPTGQRRTWRDVVNSATFRARLDQRREPTPRDNMVVELTEALRRAIQRQTIWKVLHLTPGSTLKCSLTLSHTPFNQPSSEKRLLSTFVQHHLKSRVRRAHAAQRVLRSWWNVSKERVVPSASGQKPWL